MENNIKFKLNTELTTIKLQRIYRLLEKGGQKETIFYVSILPLRLGNTHAVFAELNGSFPSVLCDLTLDLTQNPYSSLIMWIYTAIMLAFGLIVW